MTAAIDWIAGLTDAPGNRRERVIAALGAVEERLTTLLDRTRSRDSGAFRASGSSARPAGGPRRSRSWLRASVRVRSPALLASRDIAVWAGDNYAYELMRRFGLDDTGGAVRASIVLYNDQDDIERLLEAVDELAPR